MITCEFKGCSKNNWQDEVRYDFSQGFYMCELHHSGIGNNILLFQSAGNPHKPWLTKAGNNVLTNRQISPDDNKSIIDRRTGKESPFVQKH